MISEQRCDLTELLVSQCAHCQGARSVEEQAADESRAIAHRPGWIEAQYPGECYRCGEPIAVGDLIHRSDSHRSVGWIGSCCADIR